MDEIQGKLNNSVLERYVNSIKQESSTNYKHIPTKRYEFPNCDNKQGIKMNVQLVKEKSGTQKSHPTNTLESSPTFDVIKNAEDFQSFPADASSEDVGFHTNAERKKQERRERQKLKKELKKEEKRFLREEELRKKRLAPKDQKVTLIDHKTMDLLLSKENAHSNVKASSHHGDEGTTNFPALGEDKPMKNRLRDGRGDHNSGKTKSRGHTREVKLSPAKLVEENILSLLKEGDPSLLSPAANNPELLKGKEVNTAVENSGKMVKRVEEKPKGKRPKRFEPICVQIEDILKISVKTTDPGQKSQEGRQQHKEQRYGGNILDSDNPERKRGKQRETPKKKKVSTLKAVVLKDRENRRLQREAMGLKENSGVIVSGNLEADESSREREDTINSSEASANKRLDIYEKREESIRGEEETSSSDSLCVQNNQLVLKEETDTIKGLTQEELHKSEGEASCDVQNPFRVSLTELQDAVKRKIHNRRFREYCDHLLTPELRDATVALLADIVRFQDRQFKRSPLKATARRRHVTGLKEVRKFLGLHRVRIVIVAPDLEPNSLPGGLNDIVKEIKTSAKESDVPCLFAVPRTQLGRVLKKKVPVSCVAVLNYEGAENNFQTVMQALNVAHEKYQLLLQQIHPITSPPLVTIQVDEEGSSPGEQSADREVVASLLAKLTEGRGRRSPFLEAIEELEGDSDEEDTKE